MPSPNKECSMEHNSSISREFRERAGLKPRGKDGKVKADPKPEPKAEEKKEPAKKADPKKAAKK